MDLQNGDVLQSTCVFDSTGLSKGVAFGPATTDEMSWPVPPGISGFSSIFNIFERMAIGLRFDSQFAILRHLDSCV